MTFLAPTQANELAIQQRAQGQLPEAIATLRAAIVQFPGVIALHQNLAQALYESNDVPGAIAEHRAALAIHPSLASHLALYELLQITGERDEALAQQRAGLKIERLFSNVAPNEQRSVLCLCMPGDWQANVPVDFLWDPQTTSVHKLYLVDENLAGGRTLPHYDVVWNTIAESPTALPYLALANYFIKGQTKPFLNAPARVVLTGRMSLPSTLANTGAHVAPIALLERDKLRRAEVPFPFPVIARPLGSQAGHGLAQLDRAEECAPYVERHPADHYFVSAFVDYASADGYYRKYRVVYVDGAPYPVHLAISKKWMIHYYNALMAEHQWMRDEEAAFLADPRAVFSEAVFETLVKIGAAVSLEYFGIDFAIDRDGRVLVFEADAAMLVHTSDPVDMYPYKHQYIPRIYRAVEKMLDRRK
jgi:tetratricopeptide (TPR) repeat protein